MISRPAIPIQPGESSARPVVASPPSAAAAAPNEIAADARCAGATWSDPKVTTHGWVASHGLAVLPMAPVLTLKATAAVPSPLAFTVASPATSQSSGPAKPWAHWRATRVAFGAKPLPLTTTVWPSLSADAGSTAAVPWLDCAAAKPATPNESTTTAETTTGIRRRRSGIRRTLSHPGAEAKDSRLG